MISRLFTGLAYSGSVSKKGAVCAQSRQGPYLGTVILTNLANKKDSFQHGEDCAQPTSVQLVIDVQQRMFNDCTIGRPTHHMSEITQ